VLTRQWFAIVAPVTARTRCRAGLRAAALRRAFAHPGATRVIDPPRTILNYLVLIGGEVLIGLTLRAC
jgi:hypothetical protein